MCKICFQEEINTVLVSCGHIVACSKCAERLQEMSCPICKSGVCFVQKTLRALSKTRTIAMSELRVCARLLSGEQCYFVLPPTATAWDLHGAIKEKLGIRRRYQQLVVGVDLLCGNTNLSQLAPQELARIMLVITETRACGGCGAEGCRLPRHSGLLFWGREREGGLSLAAESSRALQPSVPCPLDEARGRARY